MEPVWLGGLLALDVSCRWAKNRASRKHLERTRVDYGVWIAANPDPPPELRRRLSEQANRTVRAIRDASEDDGDLVMVDSVDHHPYLGSGSQIRILDNFLAPRTFVQEPFLMAIDRAIEEYRRRERAALNPIAWLARVAFLPRDAARFLGWQGERGRFLVTWFQILYWVGILAGGALWLGSVASG